jgi:hypothetical protein
VRPGQLLHEARRELEALDALDLEPRPADRRLGVARRVAAATEPRPAG